MAERIIEENRTNLFKYYKSYKRKRSQKVKIKKRDESMGGALWKEFCLNILSKLKASYKKKNKKRLVWGLHPMAILADMAAWKQVFRIHDDNPDRTSCRPISIKILHCVAEKKRTACFIKSKALGLNLGHADEDLRTSRCALDWLRRTSYAMEMIKRAYHFSFGLSAGLKGWKGFLALQMRF